MIKIKKSAVLAGILGFTLALSGCGGGGGGTTDTPAAQPSDTPATTPKDEGDGGKTAEKPGLRMIMQYGLFDPKTEYVAKYIQERTGFNVEYELLPAENADEKLNLLVSSKDNYDLVKLNAAQFYNLASAGALEPIDELLESHGNYIKQSIKQESFGSATIDGKIFGIPETGAGVSIGEELVVRQDWMDELGLSTPTTADELYNVLKTIKEKKKVIPLTMSKDSLYGDIATTFGILTDWKEVDGKLLHRAEQPEMKEYITFMNKLYKEGLLDTETPINTAQKSIEKFSGGNAAMYKLAWWNAGTTIAALEKNFPDAKTSIIPYLKGKDGKAVVGAKANTTWYVAILKSSKNKDAAMEFLNAKMEPETFKGIALGKEGVHHEVKDGKYYPILPIFNDELNNASSFLTGVDEEKYPIYWQARVRKDPILQAHFEAFQKNAEGIIVVDPMSTAPPIEAVSKNLLKLTTMLDDNVLQFISGAKPIDAYDQFLAQWRAEGGADMVNAANEWFQSTK
ncbi:extracellular solute-binding protein [Paenibacillus glucanolyticus]|uniref:extracellular solute-binding protein n=1 Tax=Paenibacillus TaxID=44249 RepID=UPI001164E5DF|nr:extracellular solute-binding protein [Paenibacillus sp. Cedars]AWP28982.1 ABC transporter substrate-binding protein [Paenibacillus sp. Cedars]|eukprot:TRINITY_DN13377_c0_g1_i1.p1 TRINITY_DN13377_c0_g1~~TRINITY_DN13377_c0_g1_i1.p1  ORF type:complete len:511 (-),score=82.28 TRINITY_DN13377_c0_g1_i1:1153-2685(-)